MEMEENNDYFFRNIRSSWWRSSSDLDLSFQVKTVDRRDHWSKWVVDADQSGVEIDPFQWEHECRQKALKDFQKEIAYVEQKDRGWLHVPITVKEVVSLGLYPKMRMSSCRQTIGRGQPLWQR